MKKVKVMLTAMIILGTVGGVLAIKAKRDQRFCTAAVPIGGNCTPAAGLKCLAGTIQKIDASGVEKCYKVTTNPDNCSTDNQDCTAKNKLTADS